jgi:hypothetical protein
MTASVTNKLEPHEFAGEGAGCVLPCSAQTSPLQVWYFDVEHIFEAVACTEDASWPHTRGSCAFWWKLHFQIRHVISGNFTNVQHTLHSIGKHEQLQVNLNVTVLKEVLTDTSTTHYITTALQ